MSGSDLLFDVGILLHHNIFLAGSYDNGLNNIAPTLITMSRKLQTALSATCKAELNGELYYQKLLDANGVKVRLLISLSFIQGVHFDNHFCFYCLFFCFKKQTAKEDITFAHFPLFHKLSEYFQLIILDRLQNNYTTLSICKEEVNYFRYLSVSFLFSFFWDFVVECMHDYFYILSSSRL